MSAETDLDRTVPLNGRFRNPILYLLAAVAFGVGGGGGWLVGADAHPLAVNGRDRALLQQQLDTHVRQPSMHGDMEKLRVLVQSEIDRSLHPIERELAEIRATLERLHTKLDRAMRLPTTAPERTT